MAKIIGICTSEKKGTQKTEVESITTDEINSVIGQ